MYQHEAEKLRVIASRIENLESEKTGLQDDIKEAYEDAKLAGFKPKVLRKAIKARKSSASERQAEQDLLDLYLAAIDGQTDLFVADPTLGAEVAAETEKQLARRGLRRKPTESAELH